jgi:hypothetical protein
MVLALVAEEEPVPLAPRVARSMTKLRNGATPVPGPTMITGMLSSAGSPKCESATKIGRSGSFIRARSAR